MFNENGRVVSTRRQGEGIRKALPNALFSNILACSLAIFGSTFAVAGTYRLGPEDRLNVRVNDWRRAQSTVHQWEGLTGVFVVGASGNVAIPLLGEIRAVGLTTAELGEAISTRLQKAVGLSGRPDASVEIIEYRPFYILGMVTAPGKYPYQPDLTVLQAVSLAGGVLPVTSLELMGVQRGGFIYRTDAGALETERLTMKARLARLEAELNEQNVVVFPHELVASTGASEATQIVREEQLLFDARRQARLSETARLQQAKKALEAELEALRSKLERLQTQVELAKREQENIRRQTLIGPAMSSDVTRLDGAREDVELALGQARRGLDKADRAIAAVGTKIRSDILSEISAVRMKLKVNLESALTMQSSSSSAQINAPPGRGGQNIARLIYRIVRADRSPPQTIEVDEGTKVLPGDVVRVERADGDF